MSKLGVGDAGYLLLGFAAGSVGATLGAIGITTAQVIFGALGCVIGISFAPTASRWRAGAVFLAASLLSAKCGAVTAEYLARSENVAGGIAALTGIFFHPAVQFVTSAMPDILRKRFAS